MKKITFLISILISTNNILFAQPVSFEKAKEIAKNQLLAVSMDFLPAISQGLSLYTPAI